MISTRTSYWESSQRPLYPKWVWSDEIGHRHFIIDHEIRKGKILNNKSAIGLMPKAASFDIIRDNETMNETRRMSEAVTGPQKGKKNVGHRGSSTPKPSVHFLRRELNRRLAANHHQHDGLNVETEICSNQADAKATQKNPLADRVINWLDLAGLNTLIRAEQNTDEKIPVRRVCTTESLLQRPSLQSGTRFTSPLRRSESVHRLSLTFNDIEIPNQVPSDKSTFQCFSSAYRASRALLAAHQTIVGKNQTQRHSASGSKNTSSSSDGTDSTKGNIGVRTRHQSLNRKSSSSSGITNDEIEKQYRSLIQRQILEKSCNIQAVRRQLHIFMPSLPDKNLLAPGGLGVADGDTSSYLSTILSSGF